MEGTKDETMFNDERRRDRRTKNVDEGIGEVMGRVSAQQGRLRMSISRGEFNRLKKERAQKAEKAHQVEEKPEKIAFSFASNPCQSPPPRACSWASRGV